MKKRISSGAPGRRSFPAFFALSAALYLPILLYADVFVFPHVSLINFAALIPITAALVLSYREKGFAGAAELLKRCFDYKRVTAKSWYLPALLLYPSIAFAQYGLALVSGPGVPTPHFTIWIPLLYAVLFIAALGEEAGWMGYAFEPMEERFGTFPASIILGVVWAMIHIPLFTTAGAPAGWIAWQCLYIAATRILFVWIYNNSGRSLFAVSLAHAGFNIGWQFFPPDGSLLVPSFYDPRNLAVAAFILSAAVVYLWGPKNLAEFRFARQHRQGIRP